MDFDPAVFHAELLSPAEHSIWPEEDVVAEARLRDDSGYAVYGGSLRYSKPTDLESIYLYPWSEWDYETDGTQIDYLYTSDTESDSFTITFHLNGSEEGDSTPVQLTPSWYASDNEAGLLDYRIPTLSLRVHTTMDGALSLKGVESLSPAWALHDGRQVTLPINDYLNVYDLRGLDEGDPIVIPVLSEDGSGGGTMDILPLTWSPTLREVNYTPTTEEFVSSAVLMDGEPLVFSYFGLEHENGTFFLPLSPEINIPAGTYLVGGGFDADRDVHIFGRRAAFAGEPLELDSEGFVPIQAENDDTDRKNYFYPTVLGQAILLPTQYMGFDPRSCIYVDPASVDELLLGAAYYYENIFSRRSAKRGYWSPEYIMLYDVPAEAGNVLLQWKSPDSFDVRTPKQEYLSVEPVKLEIEALCGGLRLAQLLYSYDTDALLPLTVELNNLSTGERRTLSADDWRGLELGCLPAGQYRADVRFVCPDRNYCAVTDQQASCSFLVLDELQEHAVYLTGPESGSGEASLTVLGVPGAEITLWGVEPDGAEMPPQTVILDDSGRHVFTVALTRSGKYTFTADSVYQGEALSTVPFTVDNDMRVPSDVALTAEPEGSMDIRLRWEDREAFVTTLHVYRDGEELAQLHGSVRTYHDLDLPEQKAYVYSVVAEGKNGLRSRPVEVHCTPVYVADNEPPAAPRTLDASAVGTRVKLFWARASDNEAVAGYLVYRDGEELASVTDARSYTDAGLQPDRQYTYAVAAFDAAGNISVPTEATVAIQSVESIEEIEVNTERNTEGAILGKTLHLNVRTGVDVDALEAELRYSDGEERTVPLTLTQHHQRWSARWSFPEKFSTLRSVTVRAYDADGVLLASETKELNWPRAQDFRVRLTLPNAGYARSFLSREGVLTLEKTGTMESYRKTVDQAGNVGEYTFAVVTPGEYRLILSLRGKPGCIK